MGHYLYHPGVWVYLLGIIGILAIYANTLNPFAKVHRIKKSFQTRLEGDEIILVRHSTPRVRRSVPWKIFAYYKCAWHIVSNVRGGSRARGKTLDAIIRDVHRLRFNPRKPYLISGDHFNVLYPRNLGVFYYATLDSRTALDADDWEHRQRIYLQTVAYALEIFASYGDCTTTIVPVGPRAVSCVNIYKYPSDSLYGILYALTMLIDNDTLYTQYSHGRAQYPLQTKNAAQELLARHRESISMLLKKYYDRVYDKERGLIRTDIAISSAKDAVLRQSSFYDNVIFWKTFSLARNLGFLIPAHLDLTALKSRILDTYWSEEAGHFLDDDSPEARSDKHYSADWLAAFFTGFLDANDPNERRYLYRSAAYTIDQDLDLPFPLRYQETNRSNHEFFLVRLVVPAYGGSAIWSFWGAEFIKLLLVLSRFEGGREYLERARKHILTYEKRMITCRGYPEVYTADGSMLRSPLYQSVRQTGWVVGFEQAQELLRAMSISPNTSN